ncbi:MAG TPA: ABC transporter permease [Roseiflexaceae bacterium]|nr:ABC transporter permease [Roseiflexaceae bacterium]
MAIAIKNLWRRKGRTLLTTFGIAVGVAAVIVLSAFAEGLASGFSRVSASSAADLTVAQKDAVMVILSTVDEEVGAEIAAMSGVDEVAGVVVGWVQLEEAPYFFVAGHDPRSFAVRRYQLVAGQPLSGRRQMLLGRLAAQNFKKQVGDTFRMGGVGYRVVGIYETGNNLEDTGAVITLEDAQRAFSQRRQVSYFSVKLKDPSRAPEVRAEIERRWPDLAATRTGEPSRQDEILSIYRSMGWFLSIFAVLVGGLGMMNAMLMSVLERTREIGVLRALGWRRQRVIGMVLGESLALGLAGGLLGIALGLVLIALASSVPAVQSIMEDTVSPGMFAQALVVALALGAVGGAYPAWRASRLAPVEAMRSEGGATVRPGRLARALAGLPGSGTLRGLLRRPARTLMTMVGIGIGVGFVVVLLAMTAGTKEAFTSLLSAGQADLIAEQANVSDASLSKIDERVADQIRLWPEVRSVSKLVFGTTTAPGMPFFLVYGLDPHESYIQHYRVTEGRTLQGPREILLGRFAANSLKKGVGDTIRLSGSRFTIVGIYETGMSYEDAGGVIALKEAQRLFRKPRQVSFIGISLHDPAQADELARRLEAAFPEVIVSKAANLTERMQDFASMNALFGALTTLTLVVGGIVMTNVMVMSVFERRQEIGVLRALGWRRRRILRLVLAESLALSLLSGAAGLLIGGGLCWLLQFEPNMGAFLAFSFAPELFVQTLALALGLGALGGIYPAWRAASLLPAESLRYE